MMPQQRRGVAGFVVDGTEVADAGVPGGGGCRGLDPLEDGEGELATGGPARWSSSSRCRVGEKLSAMALSHAPPMEPIESRVPAPRRRRPKAQEGVGSRGRIDRCLSLRWSPAPHRHPEGVPDELGADVLGDGPADDAPAPGVEDEDTFSLGGVLGDVADS
jgi:hypothetical protein